MTYTFALDTAHPGTLAALPPISAMVCRYRPAS